MNLKFLNGSIASIVYSSNGNNDLAKEYGEVYSGGKIGVVNDFLSVELIGSNKKKINYKIQDKGHKSCLSSFIRSVKKRKIVQSHLIKFICLPSNNTYLQSIKENRKLI